MKVQELRVIFEQNNYEPTWLNKHEDTSVAGRSLTKNRKAAHTVCTGETWDETSLGSGGHLEVDFSPTEEPMSASMAHIENIGDLAGGFKDYDCYGSIEEESTIAPPSVPVAQASAPVPRREQPKARPQSPHSLPSPRRSVIVEQAKERAQPHIQKAQKMEGIVEKNKEAEIRKRRELQIKKIELDARRSLNEIIGDEEVILMAQRLSVAQKEFETEQMKLIRRAAEQEAARIAAKEEKRLKHEAYEQRKRERAAMGQPQKAVVA